MIKKILLGLMILCGLSSSEAFASRYYVNGAATGNGTGTSWQNAFTAIEAAFAAVVPGDEIWVATGVYKPQNTTFIVPGGVKMYGNFVGNETTLFERNFSSNYTTLSGDINTPDVAADNSSCVVLLTNSDSGTLLEGFWIMHGYNNGTAVEDGGSALRMINSSAKIENCTFQNNYSRARGGAVHIRGGGNPVFFNCRFSNNSAGSNGNSAGGAVFIESGNVNMRYCWFMSNSTQGVGGAIAAFGGTIYMDRMAVSGGTASGNAAGIFVGDNATITMYNALIVGNVSNAASGTAIYVDNVANVNPHKFINCTISGNRCTATGFSTACQFNNSSTVKNTIVWGNLVTQQVYCVPPAVLPDLDYCIIEGGYPDTGAIGIKNQDPLYEYPGTAANAPFNWDFYVYYLTEGSPAVNSGDNSYIPATMENDFPGHARILQGIVDLGAVESNYTLGIERFITNFPFYYDYKHKTVHFPDAGQWINKQLYVYDNTGKEVEKLLIKEDNVQLRVSTPGIYMIKIGGEVLKILIP